MESVCNGCQWQGYSSSQAAQGPNIPSCKAPFPYLIPADWSRWWPCQPEPLISFFFLITSLCFHTALLITNRPHFVPVLGKGSICNVIAQMKMVERWTDTNPLFLPVSSIVFSDFCSSPLSRLSLPEAKKTPLTPFCFFPSKREQIRGTIDNICSAMCKWVQIKLNTYNKSSQLRFYSTDFHFTIKK